MERSATPKAARSWLDRTPSWRFLALLAGLILLAFVLSWLAPATFWHPGPNALEFGDPACPDPKLNRLGLYDGYSQGGFFYDYYWMPILCDEGYNTVNTLSWALLLGIMLLWAYRLTAELKESVGLSLILAVVPYLVWGSVYRVLEDADLFAPWARGNAGPMGPGFLDHFLGVFYITPIIYVEVTFVAVAFLLWAHRAKRVADAQGLAVGVQYFGYSLVVLVALYAALWASEPTYMRYVAHPIVAVGAAAVAFWLVWVMTQRQRRFDPHVGMAAYGVFFLLLGLFYVLVWMTGGAQTWVPDAAGPEAMAYPLALETNIHDWPMQAWVLLACLVGPGLATFGVWKLGRSLGGMDLSSPARVQRKSGPQVTLLVVLAVLVALGSFVTLVGMRDLAQRQIAGAWGAEPMNYFRDLVLLMTGPAAIAVATWAARAAASGGFGIHPALLFYTLPLNLLMVFAQAADAMMTSLGIDLYNYSEKHVAPGALIARVDAADLPGVLDTFPTALVFLPLKLIIVLLVVVVIDASADKELRGRENLVGLVKLGIIMVGLSPGVRDAVRLAMAT